MLQARDGPAGSIAVKGELYSGSQLVTAVYARVNRKIAGDQGNSPMSSIFGVLRRAHTWHRSFRDDIPENRASYAHRGVVPWLGEDFVLPPYTAGGPGQVYDATDPAAILNWWRARVDLDPEDIRLTGCEKADFGLDSRLC